MAKAPNITAAQLRAILDYNPETGEFRWKQRTPEMFACGAMPSRRKCNAWNGRFAGQLAGNIEVFGYHVIHIQHNGGSYKAHRLAWLWMTGEWPEDQIDHVNGERADNRFANLREATNSQNLANSKASSRNRSGHKGVYWFAESEKWRANIRVNGRLISLGLFGNKEDAAAAYEAAAKLHFGEFARTE